MIKLMPKLSPTDVADAVIYAISTPDNVLVSAAT
jgi:NADP-dependent 3-hydroxy acid dehydrogenase YdfG